MAARSKAWVSGRSSAEIVGSKPIGGMDVSCGCSVLTGRDFCDELITHPQESYRLWCIVVCDLENLMNEEVLAHCGLLGQKQTMHSIITVLYC